MLPSERRPDLGRPWSWSLTSRQFVGFALIGVVAFLVDSAVLYATLPLFGNRFAVARVLSWFCAVSFTWALNYQWTFRYRARSLPLNWLKYVLANLLGGLVNYGASIASVAFSPVARSHPVVAVAMGSIAGLFFNFVTSKALVFRGH
jgi:putative flippase GtrA